MSRNTRCGRRLEISVSAESLSRAVRVVNPSSSRMPATRSRISASSSTIRISFVAMGHPPVLSIAGCGFDFWLVVSRLRWLGGFVPRLRRVVIRSGFGVRRLAGDGKAQPHPGSPRARPNLRGIMEFDPPAMIFQDPADDREPKAGAFFAGGDIGLQQPRAAHLG